MSHNGTEDKAKLKSNACVVEGGGWSGVHPREGAPISVVFFVFVLISIYRFVVLFVVLLEWGIQRVHAWPKLDVIIWPVTLTEEGDRRAQGRQLFLREC